ncbi:MAG: N-acetylglucosamine kinase [Chitinophagales bacterium]|nr:N-acetylglucosamine kinase [Chitinophagales bacterium]
MILVADSGSTKTHWELYDPATRAHQAIYTDGISPFYRTEDEIYNVLQAELFPQMQEKVPRSIFFYGTGCSQPDKVARVANALQRAFPAASVMVDHDLMGAAVATCGDQAGIACILGTGSNSCLFDGRKIVDNVPSLGFILGDEGSGAHLGRKLLQAYYYREFPAELAAKIKQEYNMDKATVLNHVYDEPMPSQFVATFAKFISDNNQHPYMHQLLFDCFTEFLTRMVLKYEGALGLPVHFIGSIAELNQAVLFKAMDRLNLKQGAILKSPMDGLLKYHTA